MNKTKFSIIGSGYFVKIFDKNHPLYKKLKSIKDMDLKDYLTDYTSMEKLGLKDNFGDLYTSFFQIVPTKIFPVYSTDMLTRLEIRNKKAKPLKIFFKDLIRTDYLFPPNYMINETVLQNEGLLVVEYDKGYFGKTVHPCEFNNEDQLSFEIIEIPQLKVKGIKSLKANGNEVILKQPDTLSYGLYAYLI